MKDNIPGPARAGQDVLVSVAAQGAPSAGTQGCAYFVYKYCPYFPPRSDSLLLLQITKIFSWPHSRSLSLLHIFRIFLHNHTPSCFFKSQIWYFPPRSHSLLFLQFTKIFPWHHLVSFIYFVFSSPTSLPPAWLRFFTKIPCTMSNHSHQVKTLTPAGILVFQSTNAIGTAAHRRSWQIYLNRRRLVYICVD